FVQAQPVRKGPGAFLHRSFVRHSCRKNRRAKALRYRTRQLMANYIEGFGGGIFDTADPDQVGVTHNVDRFAVTHNDVHGGSWQGSGPPILPSELRLLPPGCFSGKGPIVLIAPGWRDCSF